MKSLSLNGSDWTLTCWWQHNWRRRSPDDRTVLPAWPPIPATVPGAVHADLVRARVIPDVYDGLNAMACEWVNNRDWSFSRKVTVPADFDGQLTLECDGVDYSGTVLVNQKPVGTFEGTHFRHRFYLTELVKPGETFDLELVFDIAPQVEGVYGFTSRTRIFKPRFGYYWDWCTRLVNAGIWQELRLVCRGSARFDRLRTLPRVNDDLSGGRIRCIGAIHHKTMHRCRLRYVLTDERSQVVKADEIRLVDQQLDLSIAVEHVQLWWPATHGEQPLYQLTLELIDEHGRISDRVERTVGFKRVRWLTNPAAPPDARPYLCEINGRTLFLRGVNWVPLSPLYGTVTADRYECALRLYRHMNANVLRVWGGAILETPTFYDLCDRLGLLVWQEFPLSSSGIDNWPPEDPEVIAELKRIAAEYIERRSHHACHLLWCGGNELQGALDGGKVGVGRPVDESHPLMREWATLVEELDPGKRFLTSTPSGPRFYAEAADFGKGLHHQTHGPWANLSADERCRYFNGDDSLFRSELGAPGCSSLASLKRHCGDQSLWPPRAENPHWLIPGGLWAPWNDVCREFGPIPDDPAQLPFVVKASRYIQAESYRYASEATRRRHPTCSGFIIWMGHDSVHLTANNSVIQTDASTKPAYDVLQRAYAGRHVSLRFERFACPPGEQIRAEAWIHRDEADQPADGMLLASLRSLDGRIVHSESQRVSGNAASIPVMELDWTAPAALERLFVIELIWDDGHTPVMNRYLLSQQVNHPLQPLAGLPVARLSARRTKPNQVTVRNSGAVVAVGVRVVPGSSEHALLTRNNHVCLFPGETETVEAEAISLIDHFTSPCLELEWFNSTANMAIADL